MSELADKLAEQITRQMLSDAGTDSLGSLGLTRTDAKALADIISTMTLFVISAVATGTASPTSVTALMTSMFSAQLSMFGSRRLNCITGLAAFAANVAVWSPRIAEVLSDGAVLDGTVVGIELGLTVQAAAVLAAVCILATQIERAVNVCIEAFQTASRSQHGAGRAATVPIDHTLWLLLPIQQFDAVVRKNPRALYCCRPAAKK